MRPTAEQTACVDAFLTGKALRVNAYAGTGKTTTLASMANATRKPGVYLAFNKSIATDAARKFPRHVSCSTVHAMAFRAMRGVYDADKMTGTISGGYLAARYGYKPVSVNRDVTITPRGQGVLVAGTIGRFLRSGDADMHARHVPLDGALALLTDAERAQVSRQVLITAGRVWSEMRDPDNTLPLTHDGYLHLWVMGSPQLPGEYVFLDEAQDTNGIVLRLVRSQKAAQIVAVGDRWQQLYEWRGAQNAMQVLPCEIERRLATSFRFGEALAGNASAVLGLLGESVPLRGNPESPGMLAQVTKPDAILARTNALAIAEVVSALDRDERPHLVGGTSQMVKTLEAIEGLQDGHASELPEFIGFKHWHEVERASEEPDGAELRQWVRLVGDYGTSDLRRALQVLPSNEANATVVISTGHKSKGREWPQVRLCDDFLPGSAKTGGDTADSELMLYYVACTRARKVLDLPPHLRKRVDEIAAARERRTAAGAA